MVLIYTPILLNGVLNKVTSGLLAFIIQISHSDSNHFILVLDGIISTRFNGELIKL